MVHCNPEFPALFPSPSFVCQPPSQFAAGPLTHPGSWVSYVWVSSRYPFSISAHPSKLCSNVTASVKSYLSSSWNPSHLCISVASNPRCPCDPCDFLLWIVGLWEVVSCWRKDRVPRPFSSWLFCTCHHVCFPYKRLYLLERGAS